MKRIENKRGDGLILTMVIVFIVLSLCCVISQYFYMYILQQRLEAELQRAVNGAVEYAMGDSYRQDKVGNLDTETAKREFRAYLHSDMGLNAMNQKYKDGKLVYSIRLDRIQVTADPPEFRIQGLVRAKTMFSFLIGDIQIPFKIASTNFRTD